MKLYIVEIDKIHVRTLITDKEVKVGKLIPEENWLGRIIPGGIITKVFK